MRRKQTLWANFGTHKGARVSSTVDLSALARIIRKKILGCYPLCTTCLHRALVAFCAIKSSGSGSFVRLSPAKPYDVKCEKH